MSADSKVPLDSAFLNGGASIESVRQWREAVESYFSEDWEQLRGMIMELEESIWTEDQLERKREKAFHDSAVPMELLRSIVEPVQVVEEEDLTKPETQDAGERLGNERLRELSRKIEERIQNQRSLGDTHEIHLDRIRH